MAWIEAHDSLLGHRKIARLARLLGVEKVTARGYMLTLWLNVLGQSPDGLFLSWNNPEIADAAEWTGDPQLFVDSAIRSGFIDTNEEYGCLQLHDWMNYAGSLKAAQQKRLQRKREKVSQDSPRTVPGLSTECPEGPTDQTDQTDQTRPDQTKYISSEAVRLADLLESSIRARKPDFRRKGNWAKDIDLMLRIDRRDPSQVETVIRWCQSDCLPRGPNGFCWANNILSGAKLREKYDRLDLDRKAKINDRATETRASVAGRDILDQDYGTLLDISTGEPV